MSKMRVLKRVLISSAFTISVLSLFPWRAVEIAPAVQVRILDEAGNPAGGVIVTQEWEYRAVGSEERKELYRADDQGYVVFPRCTERISLARQALSVVREIIHLPHGYGIGPYARVSAYGEDQYVWSFEYCAPSYPALKVIRLKRRSVTMYPQGE
jgi:hypothetical protein